MIASIGNECGLDGSVWEGDKFRRRVEEIQLEIVGVECRQNTSSRKSGQSGITVNRSDIKIDGDCDIVLQILFPDICGQSSRLDDFGERLDVGAKVEVDHRAAELAWCDRSSRATASVGVDLGLPIQINASTNRIVKQGGDDDRLTRLTENLDAATNMICGADRRARCDKACFFA